MDSEDSEIIVSSESFDQTYYDVRGVSGQFVPINNSILSKIDQDYKKEQFFEENRLRDENKAELKENRKFIEETGLFKDYSNIILSLYKKDISQPDSNDKKDPKSMFPC